MAGHFIIREIIVLVTLQTNFSLPLTRKCASDGFLLRAPHSTDGLPRDKAQVRKNSDPQVEIPLPGPPLGSRKIAHGGTPKGLLPHSLRHGTRVRPFPNLRAIPSQRSTRLYSHVPEPATIELDLQLYQPALQTPPQVLVITLAASQR